MRPHCHEGIKRALREGRDLARHPDIKAVAVITLQGEGDDLTGNARMYGSPESIVAAAVYLLSRVRDDALRNLHDEFAAEGVARIDAALMALGATVDFGSPEARH